VSDRVDIRIEEGIADVRLNRPEKMNALDQPMFQALIEAGLELADRSDVRAVVLSGEGRAFCAGLDFQGFASMASDAPSADAEAAAKRSEKKRERGGGLLVKQPQSPANFAQRAAWVWREVPVPVVAAVHGVAYGGGLQLALGADIRIVAPDARFSVMEIKWGLVPDMSGTQTLRHLVRQDVAKELTFTGRVVSGEEAVALGLATRTGEQPRADALELAREIAARSPDAIRAAKQLLDRAPLVSVEEGLELEARLQTGLIGGANQIEAVKSNLEKRPARFRDPG